MSKPFMSVSYGRALETPSITIRMGRMRLAGSRLGTGVIGTGFRPPC